VNKFFLKESLKERTVEVSFSDTAIFNLGDILGYVGNNRILKKTPLARPQTQQENKQLLLPGTIENDIEEEQKTGKDDSNESIGLHPPITTETEADRDKLRQVFFHEDERLVLDNLRLKATRQLDASKRLVYLFLYAHELEGRKQVSRGDINDVLKDVGLYEPHIITWISTSSDLRESNENGQSVFRLRSTGRDEAKRILEQVFNSSVPDEWPLTDRARTRSKSGSESSSSESTKSSGGKGRKKSPEPDIWAGKWKSLNLGIDGHSIVDGASNLNKGILGLWAIRKASGTEVQIVSKGNLAQFIYKAFVVKAAQSTLGSALESKNAKSKVIRVAGGYQITPTGMVEAEAMAGLTQIKESPSKGSAKKK
jgi:hypothetical protein